MSRQPARPASGRRRGEHWVDLTAFTRVLEAIQKASIYICFLPYPRRGFSGFWLKRVAFKSYFRFIYIRSFQHLSAEDEGAAGDEGNAEARVQRFTRGLRLSFFLLERQLACCMLMHESTCARTFFLLNILTYSR